MTTEAETPQTTGVTPAFTMSELKRRTDEFVRWEGPSHARKAVGALPEFREAAEAWDGIFQHIEADAQPLDGCTREETHELLFGKHGLLEMLNLNAELLLGSFTGVDTDGFYTTTLPRLIDYRHQAAPKLLGAPDARMEALLEYNGKGEGERSFADNVARATGQLQAWLNKNSDLYSAKVRTMPAEYAKVRDFVPSMHRVFDYFDYAAEVYAQRGTEQAITR